MLRLVYLGVSNAFALLRLLPMNDRDKDADHPNTLATRDSLAYWLRRAAE